jgi:hypothetical protein
MKYLREAKRPKSKVSKDPADVDAAVRFALYRKYATKIPACHKAAELGRRRKPHD